MSRRVKHYVVYYLSCPITGEIRYVGKAENGRQRFWEHIKPCALKAKTHKINWIKSLLIKGLKPEFHIIEEFNNSSDLIEAEEFYIAYFRYIGANLTNACDGGKGTPGNKLSEESIAKIREKALLRGPTGKPSPNAKVHQVVDGIELRQCIRCEKLNTLDNFFFNKKQERYHPYCKVCRAEYKRENHPYKRVSEEQVAASYAARGEASKERARKQFENPEARAHLSKARSKPIIAVHTETGQVLEFPSALKAKEAGYSNNRVGLAIKLNKPYKGFNWSFKKAA